jgi:hypothetical protein
MFIEVAESGVSSVDDRANVRKCRFKNPRPLGRPAGARPRSTADLKAKPLPQQEASPLAVTITAFTPTHTRPHRVSKSVACLTLLGGV